MTDKAGAENAVMDHLCKLVIESPNVPMNNAFPGEHLLAISSGQAPWFANIVNYLSLGILPYDLSSPSKEKVLA